MRLHITWILKIKEGEMGCVFISAEMCEIY